MYNLLLWKMKGSDLNKENAKLLLQEFAKKYHIKIKKTIPTDFLTALDEFYLNKHGYENSIQKLYNSII